MEEKSVADCLNFIDAVKFSDIGRCSRLCFERI